MGILPASLWEILYFLGTAIVVSIVCYKLRLTSVLGYLFAGLVLGPHFLGVFSDSEISQTMAEFGVVFLLFTIGLELPWEKLQELRRYVVRMGSLQVLLTSFLFGAMANYLGIPLTMAILLGITLSFSSTAVVLQLLSDQKELTTRYGRISFSVLLFQDFMVIILLAWITTLKDHTSSFFTLLWWSIFKVIVVFLAFVIFGKFLLRPLYRMISATGSSDLFFAVTLLIILATSFATESAGLSLGLGAFFGGLLLAKTEYRHQIEADMKPFRSLLLGLFFMTVGMSLNPLLMIQKSSLVGGLFFIMILGKVAIFLITCMIMRLSVKNSIRLSLLLAGGSEFAFILLKQAETANIIQKEFTQIIYLNIVLSMMATPLLSWLGNFISGRIGRELGFALKAAKEESADFKNHVIIVGFGPIGETVHNLLARRLIPHVIVDLNVSRVALGRMKKFPIFYGDARKIDVFQAFHTEKAKAVIITSNDFSFSSRLVTTLKRYYPTLKIFVRVQETEEAFKLKALGATPIAPEMFAPSFQLASAIFQLFGLNQQEIDTIIEKYRHTLTQREAFILEKE